MTESKHQAKEEPLSQSAELFESLFRDAVLEDEQTIPPASGSRKREMPDKAPKGKLEDSPQRHHRVTKDSVSPQQPSGPIRRETGKKSALISRSKGDGITQKISQIGQPNAGTIKKRKTKRSNFLPFIIFPLLLAVGALLAANYLGYINIGRYIDRPVDKKIKTSSPEESAKHNKEIARPVIVKPSSEKVEPQIAPSDPPPHTADLQPNKTGRLVSPHKDMSGHIEAVLQQPSPRTDMAQSKLLIQKAPPDSEGGEKAVLRPEPIQKAALSPLQVGATKYPFSIYLGSFMSLDRTRKAVSIFKKDHEISPYWVKVNLGNKGTWYRVFTGYFHSAAEADAFFKKKNLKECEVRRTNYAILLGEFAGQEEAEEMIHRLSQIGYSSYFMPGPEGGFKLYSGVYKTPEDARDQQAELASKGIESTVVER